MPVLEEALLKQSRDLIASRIGLLVREQDAALLRQVVAERVRALNLAGAEQYCQLLASQAAAWASPCIRPMTAILTSCCAMLIPPCMRPKPPAATANGFTLSP